MEHEKISVGISSIYIASASPPHACGKLRNILSNISYEPVLSFGHDRHPRDAISVEKVNKIDEGNKMFYRAGYVVIRHRWLMKILKGFSYQPKNEICTHPSTRGGWLFMKYADIDRINQKLPLDKVPWNSETPPGHTR